MIPRLVATVGLVGRIPVAAGTCASLAALATGYFLHWLGGFPLLLGAAVVLGGLGLWATRVGAAGSTGPRSWSTRSSASGWR